MIRVSCLSKANRKMLNPVYFGALIGFYEQDIWSVLLKYQVISMVNKNQTTKIVCFVIYACIYCSIFKCTIYNNR